MEMEMEEKFPVGMRVLAVDDDSTCLMILATMLRKCQYDVTTANEATKALQILREKKDEFDLIISDIEMPNMDGFELLQQVGLQMDIPVLLLSAHDDKERVMKGIAHGACHYLLKPARIEELKHIWQHVVRRKLGSRKALGVLKGKLDVVDHKPNKKRQDENDQQSTQKKPRVFWLPELHRKFLAAVNQLGVDKAVPKKILELMNVENITRENVASHLQKHRMYLKKRNSVPSPQANMFADFGSAHSAYGQLVPRVDNAQMLVQTVYTSYPVAANVLTTASSQGSSSEIIRWARPDNLVTIDREPNVGSSLQSMNQSRDLPHGMSIAPEFFDNGEQVKDTTPIADFSSINFANASMHNDFSVDFADNDSVLDGHLLNASQQDFSGNLSADSLTLDYPPKLPKLDGYNDSSPTFFQFESFYTEHSPSPSIGLRDNMAAAAAAHLVINPHERSSLNSVVNILPNSRTDLQHQEHPISNIARHNTDHNPIPVGNIVPGEFSTSSVSKSDIMDYPLTGHPDNVEAGEASNQIPTHSKI